MNDQPHDDDQPDDDPVPTSGRRGEPSWVREPAGDRLVESNWLFRLRVERFRSRRTGEAHDYYVVHLADAVNVVALTPDGQVLLVEQFRAGSGRDSLEPPGGLIDQGEDVLQAAERELLEETGYRGDPPLLLGTVWSNPSILSSRISTVVVANARPVADPRPEHGEEVRVHLVPARRLPAMIRNGEIGHALAVQGLLWWLVSEIPDSPLELPAIEGRGGQVRIVQLMMLVLLVALLLAAARILTQIPPHLAFVPVLVLALPVALFIQRSWLDPPVRAILLRDNIRPGRILSRLLALLGLTAVIVLAGLTGLAMVEALL